VVLEKPPCVYKGALNFLIMKKILVPTDFSLTANKALDFAVQIARQAKAEIILVHACNLIDTTFKDRQTMYKEHNQAITDKANENLLLLKKSIEDAEKLFVNTKLYRGAVTDTILQASDKHHADLIIMGTLGEAGLKEKIFGSKTAGIIGKTNVPIIAVPLLCEWNIPEKILLAVNDFEKQPDIISPVFELAELFNATVHIAIFTDVDSAEALDYLKHKRNITAYEEKLKTLYKQTVIKSVHLDGHRFQETIEEYILEHRIDIVAMVTHKRTFLESIFNRSMTKKMSYHTRIPLLAIPA
jgi:nucleotide-binding universal stress UspA family protein